MPAGTIYALGKKARTFNSVLGILQSTQNNSDLPYFILTVVTYCFIIK